MIRPRNPCWCMVGYIVNLRGWSLGLGPNNPWIKLWFAVKPERLGDSKIPHGVGGEIRWHPCLFWPSDLVWIAVNSGFY